MFLPGAGGPLRGSSVNDRVRLAVCFKRAELEIVNGMSRVAISMEWIVMSMEHIRTSME